MAKPIKYFSTHKSSPILQALSCILRVTNLAPPGQHILEHPGQIDLASGFRVSSYPIEPTRYLKNAADAERLLRLMSMEPIHLSFLSSHPTSFFYLHAIIPSIQEAHSAQ